MIYVAEVLLLLVTLAVFAWVVGFIKRQVRSIVDEAESGAYQRGFSDGREYEAELAETVCAVTLNGMFDPQCSAQPPPPDPPMAEHLPGGSGGGGRPS